MNKSDWDRLVKAYATKDFIPYDPVKFAHAFSKNSDDWRDAEAAAFISALFSYGRREAILQTLQKIFSRLKNSPVKELAKLENYELKERFEGFYYRFNKADDLVFLLARLGEIYLTHGSIKQLWSEIHLPGGDLKTSIHKFRTVFLNEGRVLHPNNNGIKFLFADPSQNSAAKRFNLFLRWMVRCDDVDLGLWKDVTSPSDLMFPLDTHVATLARHYGITSRKSNDWKTVEEITGYFRLICPQDPVKYDFALFGLGVQKNKE